MDNTVIPKWFASPIRNTLFFLIDMPIHHKNIRARPLLSLFKPDIGVLVFRVHLPTICLLSPLRCCFTLHTIPAENSCRIPVHKQP